MRARAALGLACAALAVGAAPAMADSIAYIKDGNVWLATPDGSRQQQVTRTGGYSYVSQADTGVMIALAPGERLHKLSRTGEVLADFTTMVSDGAPQSGPVTKFHGPFTPEISPDGTKVAFEWFNDDYSNEPGCSETSSPPCFVYTQSQGVAISHADRHTGPEDFGLLTGWIFPHWMANDVLLRSFSGATMNDDAVFTNVGPGKGDDELDPWFYDEEQGYGVDDVELSRDLETVVGVAGQSDEKLRVYRTVMHPFGAPDWNHRPFHQGNTPVAERCAELTDPAGGKFETPSLSPDGRGLAYATADGIRVVGLPDLAGGCPGLAGPGTLVLPGAKHPDWGPAGIPAAEAFQPGEPNAPAPGPGAKGGSGGGGTAPAVKVARADLRTALRKGLVLTVRTGGAGRLAATVKRSGATLGRRTVTVGDVGVAKVRVRLSGRAARALRRSATARLSVAVAFTPKGGVASQPARRTVTLRR